MYEATVSRVFAAAHAIRLYDGSLEPLHGHNWTVDVTVEADQLDDIQVVMDFHQLQQSLDALIEILDNNNLNQIPPFGPSGQPKTTLNPTAESVAWWFADQLSPALPKNVRLQVVKVGEAPDCTAAYRPN